MSEMRLLGKKVAAGLMLGLALAAGASAQEQSSVWYRTGELTGQSQNRGRAFTDARLLSTRELTISVDAVRYDSTQRVRFEVYPQVEGLEVEATDCRGTRIPVKVDAGGAYVEQRAGEVEFRSFDGNSFTLAGRSIKEALSNVRIRFSPEHPIKQVAMFYTPTGAGVRTNLSPVISAPANAVSAREPELTLTGETLTLENSALRAVFSLNKGLQLESLQNAYSGRDLLLKSAHSGLFVIDRGQGQVSSARTWSVKEAKKSEDGREAIITLEQGDLSAVVTLGINASEMTMGLEVINNASEPREWKTVFPHFAGLAVSEKPEDDYYLYPYYGGLVQNVNSNLRLFYGGEEAWWQMVDVFSPSEGSGVAVACHDEIGRIKGVAFRKGKESELFATHVSTLSKRLPEGTYWPGSLTSAEGSSIGFEFCSYKRDPGKSFVYPKAVLQVHEGDWHRPMEAYSRWAHSVWKGTPIHNRLDDVWDIETVIASLPSEPSHQKHLYNFVKKEWYSAYREDGIDMGEFRHWWKWSEKGPFGIDMSKGKKEVMRQMYQKWSYYFMKDPYADRLLYTVNDGDYDYNPLMGGLEGLKEGIRLAHEGGASVQLYTDPFIIDSTTQMGQNYGKRFGVVNPGIAPTPGPLPEAPTDGHMITYAKWGICPDAREYPEIFASNMARLVRDTGVDAIRLDQLGFTGTICFSKEHEHQHAEEGEHAVLQGMKTLIDTVRVACEAEKPDIILTAEYPGADYLARSLDGSLTYEISYGVRSGLRPLPTNLLRFYFPELKCYDNPTSYPATQIEEVSLWNGVGMYQRIFRPEYDRILKENSDAFRSADTMPLIPGTAEFVYGNRFSGPDEKVVTVLYNARPVAVDGPLLAATEESGFHYFDLLAGRDIPVTKGQLHLAIGPDKVGIVARLKKKLAIARDQGDQAVQGDKAAASWVISASGLPPEARGGEIVLCDDSGAALQRLPLEQGTVRIPLAQQPEARIVKLFLGKYLADAARLPAE